MSRWVGGAVGGAVTGGRGDSAGRRRAPIARGAGILVAAFALAVAPLQAQDAGVAGMEATESPPVAPTVPPPAQLVREGPSARGAFIRSLLIPGWGQVAVGVPSRGAFYFAAQSANIWMIRKSRLARGEAREFAALQRELVRAELAGAQELDEAAIQSAIDNDPGVRAWENLAELRGQQVEDWTALTLFFALLGGADALVSAHLADYPEPLALRVLPAGPEGGIEVAISLPVGGRP